MSFKKHDCHINNVSATCAIFDLMCIRFNKKKLIWCVSDSIKKDDGVNVLKHKESNWKKKI